MSIPQITRLYDTVFDRAPDAEGMAYWNNAMNAGTPLNAVAALFVTAPEFRDTYGQPDTMSFVREMYANVLDRPGEAEGVAYWARGIDSGAASRADVVVAFSESPEHVALMEAPPPTAEVQAAPLASPPAPEPVPAAEQAPSAGSGTANGRPLPLNAFWTGTPWADTVHAGPGDDFLASYAMPYGGGGFVAYEAIKADTGDEIHGGAGNDTLISAGGNDRVFGDAGDDFIVGGIGADILTGGDGADVFRFGRPGGPTLEQDTYRGDGNRDIITDFQEGRDKIDVHGLLPPDVFEGTWLGTQAPMPATDRLQVGYRVEGGSTIIQGWGAPEYAPLGGPAGAVQPPTFEIVLADFTSQARFGFGPENIIF